MEVKVFFWGTIVKDKGAEISYWSSVFLKVGSSYQYAFAISWKATSSS